MLVQTKYTIIISIFYYIMNTIVTITMHSCSLYHKMLQNTKLIFINVSYVTYAMCIITTLQLFDLRQI